MYVLEKPRLLAAVLHTVSLLTNEYEGGHEPEVPPTTKPARHRARRRASVQ
jgi:hypothetical protein